MKQHSNVQFHLNIKLFLRNFIIELVFYGSLVVGYFLLALRYLNTYLTNVFKSNLLVYAVLALALIIAQGVLLDSLTSFLLSKIKLEQLE